MTGSRPDDDFPSTWRRSKRTLIENYTTRLRELGDCPEAIQMSEEGQRFRFKKLAEIGVLRGMRILDIGCGRADFLKYLQETVGEVDYTGIDIVPELIETSRAKHPNATFLCRDLIDEPLGESFDYAFISMVFNNNVPGMEPAFKKMLKIAFDLSRVGLGFNFVSTHVNFQNDRGINHDPAEMMDFCLRELSKKVILHHHYERCDVAVFVYR